MEITKQQQQLSDLIERRLEELDLPQEPSLLYDPVRYTLDLPGKRIRPYLTLIGCGLCGGEVEKALPAAISLELLHNFTLLHDDIMDRANTRRGKPSVYKKWNSNTAILSGDAMYAKAFKELQYYGIEDSYTKDQYREILDIFLHSAEAVCEGQAYDLTFEDENNISIDQYLKMIKGKTAALISGSLTIGGAVAGGTPEQMDKLHAVGEKIGTAFQIQDDLLDAIADPEKFGKQRGGDIKEGKKTYLTLLALQRGTDQQKKLINKVLGKDSSSSEVSKVIQLYEELNIISDTQQKITNLYNAAIAYLKSFPDSSHKRRLITFCNNLISREF